MKAFDRVPHHRLLFKLESYGVCGNLLAWLESFLSGRQQRVVVRGKQSKWGKVLSGVPQGSVLGPCLFLLFVNDVVNSNISMFANDTKLYVRADTADLRKQLQEDLSRMKEWAEKWQLCSHPDKCTVLRLGKLPAEASTGYCTKKGTDSVTQSVTKVEKDLGVLVDSHLSFKDHVSQTVLKAN